MIALDDVDMLRLKNCPNVPEILNIPKAIRCSYESFIDKKSRDCLSSRIGWFVDPMTPRQGFIGR